MAKAIETRISGLKCDAPGCGYRDDTVQFEDYEKWIDRPCPTCGGNLLTRGDYDLTMAVVANVAAINAVFGDVEESGVRIPIHVDLNGAGEVAFRFTPPTDD